MTTQVLIETPIQFILIMFMLLGIVGSRVGIGTIGRAADAFMPMFIFLFFILIVTVSPQMKAIHIQPMLEKGMNPILRATIPYIGFPFLELSTFLMVIPYVVQKKKLGKAFALGTFIGGFALAILTIMALLVLGVGHTSSNVYSSYVLAQKINIAGFFTRIEVIMAVMWFISIFFKLVITFYAMMLGVAQMLGLSDYRPITIPFGMIMIVLSIVVVPTSAYLGIFNKEVWWLHAAVFGLLLPVLLLAIASLHKKKTG